jgi:hypothetical protein
MLGRYYCQTDGLAVYPCVLLLFLLFIYLPIVNLLPVVEVHFITRHFLDARFTAGKDATFSTLIFYNFLVSLSLFLNFKA